MSVSACGRMAGVATSKELMTMFTLEEDLLRLEKLAYKRKDWCGAVVTRYHALQEKKTGHFNLAMLEKVYPWMFVPFTLWAVDFQKLFEQMIGHIEDDRTMGREMIFLLQTLPELPAKKVQSVAAKHEWAVQRGDYSVQVKAAVKFELREKALMENPMFRAEWKAIKQSFDLTPYKDYKGLTRRTLVAERSMRPDWAVSRSETEFLLGAVFDLFCQKWDLYGMQEDRPLLQRPTVNLTPNGTMIFIPAWWSLDSKRDLNWKEIQTLHAARVKVRQGLKLTRNQAEQEKEALQAFQWNEHAKAVGLQGDKRVQWVAEKMKWRGEAERKLSRALRLAKNTGVQG